MISTAHGHVWSYLEALSVHDDVNVVVVESDTLRRRALAESPIGQSVKVVDSTEQLYSLSPTGVLICSETRDHSYLVKQAAGRGAAILCEKPFAMDMAEGLAMSRAVASASVPFMMAYPTRFSEAFQGLKRIADADSLGDLMSFHGRNSSVMPPVDSWFLDPVASGGGSVMDHVVHLVDVIDNLFSLSPTEVCAAASPIRPPGVTVEVGAFVTLAYENGAIGSIDCSWREPSHTGSWGGLELQFSTSGHFVDIDFYADRVMQHTTASSQQTRLRPADVSVTGMIDHFLEIASSNAEPADGLSSALRTLAVVVASRESAREGRPVSVPLFAL